MKEQPKYPITNHTIRATAIECAMPPAFHGFMKCTFVDDQGITREVDRVAFYNFDAEATQFDMHRDADTGELVVTAAPERPIMCDIMGEQARGLSVHCSNI